MIQEGVEFGSFQQLEQELMTFDDIKMILDSNLSIMNHPIPDGMFGSLFTVGGKVQVALEIFKTLERRAKLFNGYTKPHKEKEG